MSSQPTTKQPRLKPDTSLDTLARLTYHEVQAIHREMLTAEHLDHDLSKTRREIIAAVQSVLVWFHDGGISIARHVGGLVTIIRTRPVRGFVQP